MTAGFDRVVGLDALDAELANHNVVLLAAPLTPDTKNLLTAERLDLMPRETIIVNVARGAQLDEAALAERLASGRIRAAVLDVFREEPLPPASVDFREAHAVAVRAGLRKFDSARLKASTRDPAKRFAVWAFAGDFPGDD